MTAIRFDDLKQYSDVLRSHSGTPVTVRFVEPRDAEALQNYFRVAVDPLPLQPLPRRHAANCRSSVLEHFIHIGEADRFSVIATMQIDGFETIVGEARYAFDADTGQLRIRPVGRRPLAGPWHRLGVAEEPGMPRRRVRRRSGCSATRCAPTTP